MAPHRRVFATFFLYAFSFGGFFPRLAELQKQMGLTESALGLGLIGEALIAKGYSEADTAGVLGGNWLRVLEGSLPG